MQKDFSNEPFTDFSKEESARAMREAIEKVKGELGREYPLVIGTERIKTEGKHENFNPAKKTEVVGRLKKATADLAGRAFKTAAETFKTGRFVPATERAEILFRGASIWRER